MKTTSKLGFLIALAFVPCAFLGSTCWAIDALALRDALARGEKLTVVDVRTSVFFQREHIPGAINIPATLVPEKNLPPLGWVVVYDEGLGRDQDGAKAVVDFNKKKGISAEALEGGFASWQAVLGTSTKGLGVHEEELTMIPYDQLKKANPETMVLVDLRKPRPQVRQDAQGATPVPPLTDLAREFPQSQISKSPFDLPQARQSATGRPAIPPVLVLIDDGDGSAQAMARTLKAGGATRVLILAGGESILARHGQPGLMRSGSTSSQYTPNPAQGAK